MTGDHEDCGGFESDDVSFGASFLGPKNRKFPTTHWSFIVNAQKDDSESAARGLESLCRQYWYPLYSYVRKKGYSSHDAQELTQSFFADLLSRKSIEKADESKGKFRSYLLGALNHFLINDWRSKSTQKRGGGEVPISIEADAAEDRFKLEPVDKLTPEKIYQRNWALAVLNSVIAQLEEEYSSRGKSADFSALSQFLSWNSGHESYKEVAHRLGRSEGAIKTAVNRMRTRYRELLLVHIERTVVDPADVDEEINFLLNSFR